MADTVFISAKLTTRGANERFFSAYAGCLNPILTVADILARLREESRRYPALDAPWQREESRINTYLLLAAACCAIDDYLAYRPLNPRKAARLLGPFRPVAEFSDELVKLTHAAVRAPRLRPLRETRALLGRRLDSICALLASSHRDGVAGPRWEDLRRVLEGIPSEALPDDALRWRMRIPEGYRCQDLTHHDVISMGELFAREFPPDGGRLLVIGPRTAGGYFAPLLNAWLAAHGYTTLGWMSIRPKDGLAVGERRRLKKLLPRAQRVVIVDDHPNTGHTHALMVRLLGDLGVPPASITILAPGHAAQADWRAVVRNVSTVTLPAQDTYKRKLANDDGALCAILGDFYRDEGWESVRVERSPQVEAANARLAAPIEDGFQARVKRLLQVRLCSVHRKPVTKFVLAKSTGWGWLGYHGYLAGARLSGHVPRVIGWREGLLFSEWIGPLEAWQAPRSAGARASEILEVLPAYLAARRAHLALKEDPGFASRGYRWTGWDAMRELLSGPYGPFIGRAKAHVLRRHLECFIAPVPVLTDGRMSRAEWVADATGPYKVDYEHHNFGGGELDLVDLAHDIAGAVFELGLSRREEQALLDRYIGFSGDRTIRQRLPLYKLLYGVTAMNSALYKVSRAASPEQLEAGNERYLAARNFLTSQMNRYAAGRLTTSAFTSWTTRLFVLDLDGVLDWDHFAFPVTTPSGLLALHLLKTNEYSIVLNTGRSVAHVRDYCRAYGLSGGVAEYGSVFVDRVRRTETPLLSGEARQQLRECACRLREIAGVCVDRGYEYAVRAYRFRNNRTAGLAAREIAELLNKYAFDRLGFIARGPDTYLVEKGVNKGTALRAASRQARIAAEVTVAIGDSAEDLEMLRAADVAYISRNHAPALRELTRSPHCRAMPQPLQRGLLAAVRDVIGREGRAAERDDVLCPGANPVLDSVLLACERPAPLQWLLAFTRRL